MNEGLESNGPDLTLQLVLVLIEVNDGLAREHLPAQQRLRHGVDLIIVRTVGEGGAFLDAIVYPQRKKRSAPSTDRLWS